MGNTFGMKIRHSIKYLKIRIKDTGRRVKDKDLVHFFIAMDANLKVIFIKT